MTPIIYHGTPLTPRAALTSICTGRAMCVSFFRPDDVEVVEAISPDVMFRQRGVFLLASGAASWRRLERDRGLAALLRVARAEAVCAWTMGYYARHPGRTIPAQRQHTFGMAVRSERRPRLAYGWANRTAVAAVRASRPGLSWVDWTKSGVTGLSRSHGRGGVRPRRSLACPAHAARDSGGFRLSLCVSRQHQPGSERVAV